MLLLDNVQCNNTKPDIFNLTFFGHNNHKINIVHFKITQCSKVNIRLQKNLYQVECSISSIFQYLLILSIRYLNTFFVSLVIEYIRTFKLTEVNEGLDSYLILIIYTTNFIAFQKVLIRKLKCE